MRPRGQKRYLALSIMFGVLWVAAGVLQPHVLGELSVLQKLALGVMTLPLLWLMAYYLFMYWRGRRGRST